MSSVGYSDITYFLTTSSGVHNILNIYFDGSVSQFLFKTYDYQTLQAVPNITITMNQNINGSIVTYAQLITDVFGLANFYLDSSVEYYMVAVGNDVNGNPYDVFTGKVTPSSLASSPYNIYLTQSGSQFRSVFDDVNYQTSSSFDGSNVTVNMFINSLSGSLSYFSLGTVYNGVSYLDNVSVSPSGGVASIIFPFNFSISDFNVTFIFSSSLGYHSFVSLYHINNESIIANTTTNGTMSSGMFNDVKSLPNTSVTKGFFGVFIIIFLAIIGYRMSGGVVNAGLFLGGVGTGISWYYYLLPSTYCLISLLLFGIIFLSNSSDAGGY